MRTCASRLFHTCVGTCALTYLHLHLHFTLANLQVLSQVGYLRTCVSTCALPHLCKYMHMRNNLRTLAQVISQICTCARTQVFARTHTLAQETSTNTFTLAQVLAYLCNYTLAQALAHLCTCASTFTHMHLHM